MYRVLTIKVLRLVLLIVFGFVQVERFKKTKISRSLSC